MCHKTKCWLPFVYLYVLLKPVAIPKSSKNIYKQTRGPNGSDIVHLIKLSPSMDSSWRNFANTQAKSRGSANKSCDIKQYFLEINRQPEEE